MQLNGKVTSMNQSGVMLRMPSDKLSLDETDELLGEEHIGTSYDTPLRTDAFDTTDEEKIKIISLHFREIMNTLGLDLNDDSLRGTPGRVAKMFVKEIFSGLDPKNRPKVALFDNKYKYNQMLVEKNITLYSNCEHHFVYNRGACCLYLVWKSYRFIKDQPDRAILFATAAGAGKVNHSNSE
jgi:GTP cyclohydrolase I